MYHYTECGLQNVWLENGYRTHKTAHGRGVSIDDVAGLHKLIGREIAKRPGLTGAEFRFLRKEMELAQSQVAVLLGTSEQNISLWERRGKIPRASARLLKVLYLERLDGNVKVMKLIENLIVVDADSTEKLRFRSSSSGHWKSAA